MFSLDRLLGAAALLLVLSCAPLAACDSAEVDPRLVGTWQLQWPGAPIYWTILEDGTYRTFGPGVGLGETGAFTASAGRWSLQSPSSGEDGGTYELQSEDLFSGTGKLGPGLWARVRTVPPAATAVQTERALDLPADVPALLFTATQRARAWRSDALPVSLEYQYVDAPNVEGPELRFSFLSPASGTGLRLTMRAAEIRAFEFNERVDWGKASLPPVFVDLPTAARKAQENGMAGPVARARLAVHSPPGAPEVLAWIVAPSRGEGKTVDGTTGRIIDFDVTGYVAAYNAQWQEASTRLAGLLRRLRPAGASPSFDFWSSGGVPTSSGGDAPAAADTRQQDAAGRAYWASSEDYSRILNGECDMRMNAQYGC
jgi:hypothetical protein